MPKASRAIDPFVEFVLDQLRDMEEVRAKRMFSGYGLYRGDVFFGIVSKARLYFKTDEKSRKDYVKRDMGPFQPTAKVTLKSYYELPADVLEDRELACKWAMRALKCSGGRKAKEGDGGE
jgi:DNA transformation protein